MSYFPMSSLEYRSALETLDITQTRFGELLNVSQRTANSWASGDQKVPAYAAIILRMLAVGEIKIEQLRHGAATPLAARLKKDEME